MGQSSGQIANYREREISFFFYFSNDFHLRVESVETFVYLSFAFQSVLIMVKMLLFRLCVGMHFLHETFFRSSTRISFPFDVLLGFNLELLHITACGGETIYLTSI